MLNRSYLRGVLLAAFALSIAGCGVSLVDSITVSPATAALTVGQSEQFLATGTYGHGSHPTTQQDVTSQVAWGTSNPNVANISSKGVVTAVSAGTATISASMQGFTGLVVGDATVTVTGSATTSNPEGIASLTIIPGSQTVAEPGETGQFIAIATSGITGLQSNLTNSVSWTSSSPSVAKISTSGLATALAQGATTLTALARNIDGSVVTATATFTVTGVGSGTPEPITSLTLIPAAQTVSTPGLTGQFIAIATAGGTGLQSDVTSSVTWSSSNVGVGTINSSGLATGVGQGLTAITAIAKNIDGSVVTATGSFTVSNAAGASPEPIASVAIIPSSQSVAQPGQTGQFIAIATAGSTGLQSNLTSKVAWSSSNTAVATINGAGLATGVGQGTTAITAIATNPDGTVVTATGTFTVTGVTTEPLQSLALIPASQSVATPGLTGQFIAIGTYAGSPATTQNLTTSVTWSSANTAVATMNAAGLATGVGQGTTAITAIAKNPDGSVVTATGTFTVTSPAGTAAEPTVSLALVPASQAVASPGLTGQFIAIGTAGGTGLQSNLTSSVTWSSSNVSVATINAAGLATAVAQGTTAITAIAKNPDGSVVTATGTFTVTNATTSTQEPTASLAITPAAQTVGAPGGTGQFIAIGTSGKTGLQNNMTTQVAWSSSNVQVATITSGGLATGVGQGTTAITAIATNPDGSVVTATGTFTVTNAAVTTEAIGSLAILPGSQAVNTVGQTGQFIAVATSGVTGLKSILPAAQVAWSSSSAQVATITAAGLATGVGQGTTAITAIAKNADGSAVTATATFTVLGAQGEPVGTLTIVPTSESVAVPFQTGQYVALGTNGTTGLQSNLTNTVAWSSSNTSVATVSSVGLVTGLAAGTTTITAIATNPDLSVVSATAIFTVAGSASEPLQSISILPSSLTVASPGQTSQFIAVGTETGPPVTTENLTTTVTWSSSNTAVATISASGLVTAVNQGAVAITAIAKNPDNSIVTSTATFTVLGGTAQQVSALTVNPKSVIAAGQTAQYVALGTAGTTGLMMDETASAQLTWSSTIPTVASVNATGLVTAIGTGTTNINAEYKNPDGTVVQATATFNVTGTTSEPLLGITIIPGSPAVDGIAEQDQFIAVGAFSNAPMEQMLPTAAYPITWSSADTTVATISSAGVATALSEGTTAIIATATNPDGTVVTGSATFTVNTLSATGPLFSTLTIYNLGTNTTTWEVQDVPSSGPGLIHCGPAATGGSVCVASYPLGATVKLTETPTGTGFGGWSSNCDTAPNTPNTTSSCTLTLTTNESVGAIFN